MPTPTQQASGDEGDGSPMLLTREQLTSHVAISGGTKSGKTAALCGLVEQIVRLPPAPSLLVVDGKGTPSN
jgi:hypothetical protein